MAWECAVRICASQFRGLWGYARKINHFYKEIVLRATTASRIVFSITSCLIKIILSPFLFFKPYNLHCVAQIVVDAVGKCVLRLFIY